MILFQVTDRSTRLPSVTQSFSWNLWGRFLASQQSGRQLKGRKPEKNRRASAHEKPSRCFKELWWDPWKFPFVFFLLRGTRLSFEFFFLFIDWLLSALRLKQEKESSVSLCQMKSKRPIFSPLWGFFVLLGSHWEESGAQHLHLGRLFSMFKGRCELMRLYTKFYSISPL